MEKSISTDKNSKEDDNKNFRVGIIGSGHFGEAMASLLARNENIREISIHTPNQEKADEAMNSGKLLNFKALDNEDKNLRRFSEKIRYTNTPEEVVNETTDIIFSLLGAQDTPSVMEEHFKDLILKNQDHIQGFFCGTKGVIEETRKTISQYLRRSLGDDFVDKKYGYFYGPMFADLILKKHPTIVGLSAHNKDILRLGSAIIRTNTTTVHDTNKTVEASEIVEAFKNVAAIASGMALGKYGENTAYSIQSIVINEIKFLCKKLGLKNLNKVFRPGSASMSDLSMTCNSSKSRNFKTGFNTTAPEENHFPIDGLAEGVDTVKAIYEMAIENGIDIENKMPVCHAVYRVLHKGTTPERVIPILLKKIDQNRTKKKKY